VLLSNSACAYFSARSKAMAPESSFEAIASSTAVAGELDLEAVIARFAGDDSRLSHALPASLCPDQRQLAKKLVGGHPHLECESYGFGPERRLHIFKKRAGTNTGCGGVRMRVKNTFIDAWLSGEKLGGAPVFRSLPSDWRSMVVAALVAPTQEECESVQDGPQGSSIPSPDTSPKMSESPSPTIVITDAQDNGQSWCESMQDDDQVCFGASPFSTPKLHNFPSSPLLAAEVHDALGSDLRTSPSLSPSQPILAAEVKPAPLLPPPCSPSNVAQLSVGTEVEIHGLLQRPDFNGLSGIVQSWDPMLRRYDVLLHGSRHVKAKRENLLLKPPPPPPSVAAILATTIDLSTCIPTGFKEGIQHSDLAIDAASCSPNASLDTPGWFQWQFNCESGVSPHGWHGANNIDDDGNMPPSIGATWDYNNCMATFNEAGSNFDSPENPGWMQQPLCDAGMAQGAWHLEG